MTIYIGSRYEDSVVDFFSTNQPDNVAPVVFFQFPSIGQLEYVEYVWKLGDRLDNISNKFYRTPENWWVIAAYNPEVINPMDIAVGTRLRIPNV